MKNLCCICKQEIISLKKIYIVVECPICLTSESDNEEFCVLDCGHVYHKSCISGIINSSSIITNVRFNSPFPNNTHSQIYYENIDNNFASLNSGDNNLCIGRGSINLEFKKELTQYGHNSYHINVINQELYKITKNNYNLIWLKTPNGVINSNVNPVNNWHEKTNNFKAICGLYKTNIYEIENNSETGFVSIFIFKEDKRPKHNKNIAMIYTVGPYCNFNNYTSKDIFLKKLKLVGVNISVALKYYNDNVEETDKIKIIRICLVSGGRYKHVDATKIEVAKTLIIGLSLPSYNNEVIYDFAYDENSFKTAYDQLLLDNVNT